MVAVLAEHRRLFATLGLAVLLVGPVRGAIQVVLPLWGESLGLAPAVISTLYGLYGACDTLVFYPAGKVMDKWGRLWVSCPSVLLLSVALGLLLLTGNVWELAGVAMMLGIGHGVGAGMLMTLGGDVSPAGARAQFLGVWRLLGDAGQASGPLVIAFCAGVGSLAVGVLSVAGIGVLAAVSLAVTVPRWTVHANRRTRKQAGLSPDGGPLP
jgi:MFS family permease